MRNYPSTQEVFVSQSTRDANFPPPLKVGSNQTRDASSSLFSSLRFVRPHSPKKDAHLIPGRQTFYKRARFFPAGFSKRRCQSPLFAALFFFQDCPIISNLSTCPFRTPQWSPTQSVTIFPLASYRALGPIHGFGFLSDASLSQFFSRG